MWHAPHSLHDLDAQLLSWFKAEQRNKSARVVGFSGGLDSTVLLHRLVQIPGLLPRIRAVHVHHGLQAQAEDWAEHCARMSERMGVQYQLCRVAVTSAADLGIEAAAREARYAALREAMSAGDVLMLAQHQQDQAETLMLQLFRGGGVAGMAAMPAITEFKPGWLLRPLLAITRAELESYAAEQDLQWVEDPSNHDIGQDRNYLRNKLLPLLRERWPGLDGVLARTAAHMGEATTLLDELAILDASQAAIGEDVLSVEALRGLSSERCRNLMRYWLRSRGLPPPSTAQIKRIEQDMLTPSADAQPRIQLAQYELRRYRDMLFLMPVLAAAPVDVCLDWHLSAGKEQELQLPPGCGRLQSIHQENHFRLPVGRYQVRFASGGERIKPRGSAHHRTLKQLLQGAAVPPWVRRRMPLIYHGQQLVAVADRWVSEDLPNMSEDTLPGKGSDGLFGLRWLDAPKGWTTKIG